MNAGTVSPSDALVIRTKVFDAWRIFPGLDPGLPDELLPADWPRAQARQLFTELYDGLAPLAALRFRQIIAVHDDSLAELTEQRTTDVWASY
jgi:phenylacetic acid degradation operon negative regulatory protein